MVRHNKKPPDSGFPIDNLAEEASANIQLNLVHCCTVFIIFSNIKQHVIFNVVLRRSN